MKRVSLGWVSVICLLIAIGQVRAQEEEEFFFDENFEEQGIAEDFEGEDFGDELFDETSSSQSKKKKADSSGEGESFEDFSDADFSTEGGEEIGFDDFDQNSEPFVSEGFDESAPLNSEEFELEPLDGSEPPVVESFPEPQEEIQTEPLIEEPAYSEPVAEPTPEPPPIEENFAPIEPVADGPDLELEARLHDIYVNFHSKAIPADEWNMLVGGRESEVYSIQSGDNLWNISRTLFNDGNYWPKIWSLNRSIENPHVIETGDSLRFVMGTEAEAPSFTVGSSVSETSEVIRTEGSGSSEVDIPPPLVESRPVLKALPPSLPEWQMSNKSGRYDEFGIDVEERPVLNTRAALYLTAYVEDESVEPMGKVAEVEGGISTAADFQYIYLLVKSGSVREGERVLLTQTKRRLKADRDVIPDKNLGVEVEVLGAAKVEGRVQMREPEEGYELLRALVEKAITNVVVGAEVRPGSLKTVDLAMDGPRSQVVAQISGGLQSYNQSLHGDQSIVFLSRGAQDGLVEGQILPVRPMEVLRNSETLVDESVRSVGYIKVVKTTPKFATAVVVKAWEEIRTGDFTGQGALLSSAADFVPSGEEASVEMIPTDSAEEDFLIDEENFEESEPTFEP